MRFLHSCNGKFGTWASRGTMGPAKSVSAIGFDTAYQFRAAVVLGRLRPAGFEAHYNLDLASTYLIYWCMVDCYTVTRVWWMCYVRRIIHKAWKVCIEVMWPLLWASCRMSECSSSATTLWRKLTQVQSRPSSYIHAVSQKRSHL